MTVYDTLVSVKVFHDGLDRERQIRMGTLLDVKQVQERLGISESTLFRMIKKRELKGFKVGGRKWRFEESDIEDYIQRQRQKSEQQDETSAA